jgi:hypothetical protein
MTYQGITTDRQFKSATGYSRANFETLLTDFEKTFQEEHGQTYENYVLENVTEPPKLQNLESCLFFTLFQLKNGMIWDSLGFVFGMSGTSAHDNFRKYAALLERTLSKKT